MLGGTLVRLHFEDTRLLHLVREVRVKFGRIINEDNVVVMHECFCAPGVAK